MQDLRLVGVHDDGEHLLLSGTGGEMFQLPIDEALRVAASRTTAKAASGALELVPYVQVTNLADALQKLSERGFQTVGLDSDGDGQLETAFAGQRLALVLGAEGKGLRQKTRETVDVLARLEVPGEIRSLNVSNAAAVALYAARRFLAPR